MLGIGTYGNKIIATLRENKRELSCAFLNIYCLQLLLSLISVLGYLLFVFMFFHKYKVVALIQTFFLLSSVIDCSWLFSGLEQFKKIVTRNVIIKVLGLIATFLFVKSSSDLGVYTLIMGLSTFLGQLIMWAYVKDYIVLVPVSWKDILQHLKPTFIYFIPQIAVQVYFVLNKTMIGILSTNGEVGIFDYADKIVKIALTIVTSLGVVMLPRMANTFAKGDMERAKIYIQKSLEFTTLLAIPIMFGLAGIAKEFVPWYMGKDFYGCVNVLIIVSPTIFFMAWSGVFGSNYLVPLGKMKKFSISLYSGALVNLIVNLILIKPYGAGGAAVGTLCAEFTVALVQLLSIKKEINLNSVFPKTLSYLISGGIMYFIVRYIGDTFGSSAIVTLSQIIVGSFVYFSVVILIELLHRDGLITSEIKQRLNNLKL